MHENSVKTIFSRLYSLWGDDIQKCVVAESIGYDYFGRKNKMFADIRACGFVRRKTKKGISIWHPNMDDAHAESTMSQERPNLLLQLKNKIKKHFTNLVKTALKTSLGAKLAKQFSRGPLNQAAINLVIDVQMKPLKDFFENLVANEKTPDENFLAQISQTKF